MLDEGEGWLDESEGDDEGDDDETKKASYLAGGAVSFPG